MKLAHRTQPETLWIVSEGSPGHDSQSRGLGEAMAAQIDVQLCTVRGRATVRGWMRPVVRAWMGQAGRPLAPVLLRWFTDAESAVQGDVRPPECAGSPPAQPPPPAPDLVISSGGKSVFAARTFAARQGVPYVYLGEQKRYPNAWFDIIISPVPNDPRPNAIEAELLPTPMSPAVVEEEAAKHERPAGRLWTMVLGGASRSHRYRPGDWHALARGMNQLANREGIRWLVTTSRRTGEEAETILRNSLDPQAVADAIWWYEKPRRELHAFLGMAESAFVTQDSVTMVTEAVASGRPVLVVSPQDVRFPADSFMPAYLENLEKKQRLVRIRINDLGSLKLERAAFSLLEESILGPIAAEVMTRLAWTSS